MPATSSCARSRSSTGSRSRRRRARSASGGSVTTATRAGSTPTARRSARRPPASSSSASSSREAEGRGALVRHRVPMRRGGAGGRHVPDRVGGLRLLGRPPRGSRPDRVLAGPVRAPGADREAARACAPAAHRRRGHRPFDRRLRPEVDERRRPPELPRRRGLHEPASRRPPRATSPSASTRPYNGNDVAGVRLWFEQGKVVREEADEGRAASSARCSTWTRAPATWARWRSA